MHQQRLAARHRALLALENPVRREEGLRFPHARSPRTGSARRPSGIAGGKLE